MKSLRWFWQLAVILLMLCIVAAAQPEKMRGQPAGSHGPAAYVALRLNATR
jgi:hypothetical protein